MSDDLIRRGDAIKSLNDYLGDCYRVSRRKYEKTMLDAISMDFEAVITNIPAVEPKQGKWIGEGDGYADGGIVYDIWYCSNCDHCEEGEELALPNFCPNCGADMRRGTDDE